MNSLSIAEIAQAVKGNCFNISPAQHVESIVTDSRSPLPDSLFFCIPGEHFDGHDFIAHALKGGAIGAVVNKDYYNEDSLPVIVVDDTVHALGDLAQYYRGMLKAKFIGITGSTGKTTTKEMLYQVLQGDYKVRRSEKSFNNFIGVPLTILSVNPEDEIAIVELGTNAPGEIRRLSEITSPEVALITNISEAHLEGLGSIEGVAKAKAEIMENMQQDGWLVTNADDRRCLHIAASFGGEVLTFGLSKEADFRAANIHYKHGSMRFALNGKYDFSLALAGKHNIFNALAVVAVASIFGIHPDVTSKKLQKFSSPALRMGIHRVNELLIINDTYNANPASMRSALAELALCDVPGRKIAILGDMLELGDYSREFHRKVGKEVVDNNVDFLFTCGVDARFIGLEACQKGMPEDNVFTCGSRDEVLDKALSVICDGDAVLLKGSRAMQLDMLASAIVKNFEEGFVNNKK